MNSEGPLSLTEGTHGGKFRKLSVDLTRTLK